MDIIRSTDLPTLVAAGVVVPGRQYLVMDWPGSLLVGTADGRMAGRVGTFGSFGSLPDLALFAVGARAHVAPDSDAVAGPVGWQFCARGADAVIDGITIPASFGKSSVSSAFGVEEAQDAAAAALAPVDGLSVQYDDESNRIRLGFGVHSFANPVYDASGRVTSFTSNGVAYTIDYPQPGQIIVAGGGKTRTVISDSGGRLLSVTTA